jgi:hypothetical protein
LLWLLRENLNQGHIYIRPAGVHGLSLLGRLCISSDPMALEELI